MNLAEEMRRVYEAVYNAPFQPDWLLRQRAAERKIRHIIRYAVYVELGATQMAISQAERTLCERLADFGRQATTRKSINLVQDKFLTDPLLDRVVRIIRTKVGRQMPFKEIALMLADRRTLSLAITLSYLVEQGKTNFNDLTDMLEMADGYKFKDLR